jgi:hypothetical protein
MAQGAVSTPAGDLTPTPRLWDDAKGIKELPSAGQIFDLKPGLNRLGFDGQWGVDFDVYTYSNQAQQAQIGDWGHTWHPGQEQVEFQKAQGRHFEERQHILRIKGTGAFVTIIAPRRKGEPRAEVQAKDAAGGLAVTVGDETLTLEP